MSVPKKEALVVLLLIGVILLMGGFFLQLEQNNNLTGAAITNVNSNPENVIAIPETQSNSSSKEPNPLFPTQNNNTKVSNSSSQIETFSSSSPQTSFEIQIDKSLSRLSTQIEANNTQCGVVNFNILLRSNINTSGTCFHINASNVVIDCAGNSINYSSAGTVGYGVNNTGFSNITIKSCRFVEGTPTTANKHAIDFRGNGTSFPSRGTIFNNSFLLSGSDSAAMNLTDANATNITSNEINITGSGQGIFMRRAGNNTVYSNRINPFGAGNGIYMPESKGIKVDANNITVYGGSGIFLEDTTYSSFTSNNVTGYSGGSYAFNINIIPSVATSGGSHYNSFSANKIRTNGTNAYGFLIAYSNSSTFSYNEIYTTGNSANNFFFSNAGENIISENNMTANTSIAGTWEIRSGVSLTPNFLMYNTSQAKIEWIDNGTGGYPRNMDSGGRLGRDYNLFIANNSVAFNGSGFTAGILNDSPRLMTMYDLPFATVTQVFRLSNISTDETFIRRTGTNCVGNGCSIVGYGANKIKFNTTLLGSFAVNGTGTDSNTAPNTTLLVVNASTYLNHTDDTSISEGIIAYRPPSILYWLPPRIVLPIR